MNLNIGFKGVGMRLGLDEIKEVAAGILGISETADGFIHFERLPKGMLINKDIPGVMTRVLCPAGVRLRFDSDTTSLRVAMRYFSSARPIFKCALVVDGDVLGMFGPDELCVRWEGELFHAVKGFSERGFEIWMPHLCHAEIEFVEIDDGAVIKPAMPPSCKWLAYGDSITQGMTVANPANTWVGIVARELRADVLNLGVGGAKAESWLADSIPDWSYDFVSIAFGVNDFIQCVSLKDYEMNLRCLVEALMRRHPQKPVFLISATPWVGRCEPNENGDSLCVYRELAEKVADETEGVIKISGSCLIADRPDLFVDSVHPNGAGMEMYGRNFCACAKKILH